MAQENAQGGDLRALMARVVAIRRHECWGGISPVTIDFINPQHEWPAPNI